MHLKIIKPFMFVVMEECLTATHMQADFSFLPGILLILDPVKALTDNLSLITAVSNDQGFNDIFVEQMKGNINEGDILICISAAESKNLINAINYAKKNNVKTISFVGFGGELLKISDLSLFTPGKKIMDQ